MSGVLALVTNMHYTKEELILEPGQGIKHYWRDLWAYRELFFFLAWRDVTVRYKQTAIGISWAIIRPVLVMIVFSIIFGKLAKLPSEGGVPYPILVYAAMLPWQLFSSALTESSSSLIGNAHMISKVYFPRLAIPTSAVVVSLVDFVIALAILAILMLWYQFAPSWPILLLPFFILLACGAALGAGLWISSLNVKYRDFRFIVPFIAQLGLYISPVGFSSSVVPQEWRLLYSLNPMVGVIDGFRWAILSNTQLYWPGFSLSIGLVFLLIFSGLWYFRKTERTFADMI